MSSKSKDDAEYVDALKEFVRGRVAGAAHLWVTTSDQNRGYGFTFSEVTDASDREIVLPDDVYNAIDSEVYDFLGNVDWNGAVGEDWHGNAKLVL